MHIKLSQIIYAHRIIIITDQNKLSQIISTYAIYCFNFFKLLFVNNIIMPLQIKNLLKHLPFYGKTIKPRIK